MSARGDDPDACPPAASEGREIVAGGVPLHYHDVGTGPSVLLLPPFGPRPGTTAWLTLKDVATALAVDHRCIVLDLPNFGLSGPIEFDGPVHDMLAQAAVSLMDALEIPTFSIAGSSVGGTTALQLALDFPERVERVVLGGCHASTGGDPYPLAPFPSEATRLLMEWEAKPTRDTLQRALEALVFDSSSITDSVIQSVENVFADGSDHAEAQRRSRNVRRSNLGRLHELDLPLLIIHGRFDRLVPLEEALVLLSYLPGADLIVLNRCGHWATFERPADYAAIVRRFLALGQPAAPMVS